jgi:hypothetical protein
MNCQSRQSPHERWPQCAYCGFENRLTPPTTGEADSCNLCGENEVAPQHQPPKRYGYHAFQPGAAAGAMTDERLAEIRRNLIEKGWRPTREETLALMSEVDRLRSSSRSSA